jgi:hypothetical protein
MAEERELQCHCGAVHITLTLLNGIEGVGRCSCSMCSRKYAAYAKIKKDNLHVFEGIDVLKQYTFHTHTSKHHFCSICGIHTHHQSRQSPDYYVFNLACVKGLRIEDYKGAEYFNGRQHPNDTKSYGLSS